VKNSITSASMSLQGEVDWAAAAESSAPHVAGASPISKIERLVKGRSLDAIGRIGADQDEQRLGGRVRDKWSDIKQRRKGKRILRNAQRARGKVKATNEAANRGEVKRAQQRAERRKTGEADPTQAQPTPRSRNSPLP
jgi:hypothetical protein